MIIGFHHVSFTVSDVQATEAFFTDLMGMTRLGGETTTSTTSVTSQACPVPI